MRFPLSRDDIAAYLCCGWCFKTKRYVSNGAIATDEGETAEANPSRTDTNPDSSTADKEEVSESGADNDASKNDVRVRFMVSEKLAEDETTTTTETPEETRLPVSQIAKVRESVTIAKAHAEVEGSGGGDGHDMSSNVNIGITT
eukprot:CAMPEP_0198253322 /NCGR_PEP_ID=MMETSP1447-20131203/3780_1 /TAXON_ID=420782 /ORGANISM="Chaetoceros dichaeta, Strain CCMP1751" /LENGTH=143 /DNA_ID=CAMNT_0043938959 /DNA_START=95 /DNA_END=522 /DNA_ORIENTATION=-